VPRGSLLWFPYFYTKRWCQGLSGGRRQGRPLFYVIHNNILLERQKAIYFYIPKVACSSLKQLCAALLDMKIESGKGDLVEEVHLLDFPYVEKYRILRSYGDYFRFCFVRNPWDRLVSCYKDKVNFDRGHVYERYENSFVQFLKSRKAFKADMVFEDFVKAICDISDDDAEGHFRSQHTFICDETGNTLVNFIGKMENLSQDFETVRAKLGTTREISHLRKTNHKSYFEYYSDDSADRVFERYKRDIELFGYAFRESKGGHSAKAAATPV
jgi:chondroitin 4-sulfotransferase 11